MEENTTKKKSKKIYIVLGIIVLVCALLFLLVEKMRINQVERDLDSYEAEMASAFPIPEYNKINDSFKSAIHNVFKSNGYFESGEYFLTKIPDRAKKVIAYGNFSNDPDANKDSDIAFILEKNDFKSSSIFLMSETGLLLFQKEYVEELPTISSFKKGDKIFMDDLVLVPAPSDGVLVYFKYRKVVLLYNPKTKSFEEYHQYTNEDLKSMKEEESYHPEDYEEESEAATSDTTAASLEN